MALSNQDRVLESSSTTGTGTYTLAGAVTGFRSFSIVGNTNTVQYSAWEVDASGNPSGGWENGLGTYTASGMTLARTTIYTSSNSNNAVSWSAGTRYIACSPLNEGTLVVRQPGGTVGTDEVQISHSGTRGAIECKDGNLAFLASAGATCAEIGGSDGIFYALYSLRTTLVNFGSSGLYYSSIQQVSGTAPVLICKEYTGDPGWFQNTAGRAITTSDATNATTTMSNLTGLSLPTLIAGRKYEIRGVIRFANSLAADGAKFDFDGGTATMTTFKATGKIFDTALLLAKYTTALATDFNVATATGDSWFEFEIGCTVNAGGTFIPRFAGNSAISGTLTAYTQSTICAEDMP